PMPVAAPAAQAAPPPPPASSAPPAPRPTAQPAPPAPAPAAAKGGLSPHTVELVQRSWSQVAPISDAAATLFYDRLFELDPSVQPLFKSDLAQQKKKLMQMLNVAVDGLNNPQRLVPVLEQLGARHAGYMVQDHHYVLVGEALLWTLREGLGESFTPETEAAWKEVYGLVAGVMKKAASSGIKAAPPPPLPAPPVPDEMSVAAPMPPVERQARGDETMPYHLLAQTRVMGMQPFAPPYPPTEALSGNAAAQAAPVAATPVSTSISIPLNVPREVTLNVHLNLKIEADSALRALAQRATQPPAPAPAPVTPPRGSVSPVLLVALCVLVSVSTVVALGPLGQAATAFSLSDLARLAAPVFTLAALAVGYFWGRGRGR
ncbi:globin family protein, partial [Hyalangium rubrum]